MSRDGSCNANDWDDTPYTLEDVESTLQARKEAAFKREKSLAYAFSHQIWRSGRNASAGNEEELEERTKWLERWMATKKSESSSRASTDKRDAIKTVEIDTSRPYSYSTPNIRLPQYQNNHCKSRTSPLHRSYHNLSLHQSQVTPSPTKSRPLQVRSASPRCHSTAHTPRLNSVNAFNGGMKRNGAANTPNYMAATESAKARVRSQSTPRQRPSTPERERVTGSAKKRLAYPVPESCSGGPNIESGGLSQEFRSPSFKSVLEQRSNFSSCYTDSLGGEISPCSTTDLRRRL